MQQQVGSLYVYGSGQSIPADSDTWGDTTAVPIDAYISLEGGDPNNVPGQPPGG